SAILSKRLSVFAFHISMAPSSLKMRIMIGDYKICAWSGRLGPKVKTGERQAPEGFYDLTRANLNPN
ncbi:hypothetical protein ACC745_38635, partial [Rhizobium ruizarguesonis]